MKGVTMHSGIVTFSRQYHPPEAAARQYHPPEAAARQNTRRA